MIWKFLAFAERTAAYAQGKGFGSASIGREVTLACQALGRSPQLAVDIGGNLGNYSAELRRRNAALEIHTFEPSTTNIEKLRRRFTHDDKITVVPFGVSDKAGEATLFADQSGSGIASVTRRRLDHFHTKIAHQERITLIRFEDYWRRNLAGRKLDIIKIDIEGHELAALNGFGEAINNTSVFQFEFGGCNIDSRTFFQDFWYFFTGNGFRLLRITPIGLQPIARYREMEEFFLTTNYLAVKRV